MKSLFFALLLLPTLVIGQERQQKESIRRGVIPSPAPSMQNRSPQGPIPEMPRSESDQKRYYRGDNAPNYGGSPNYRGGGNYYNNPRNRVPYYQPYYYDPFWDWNFGGWGWNRWNRWGAPNFYNYWNPYYYYDDFGYRQPARIYVRDGGIVDTVKGVLPRISIGVQANQLEGGAFFTIGRKTYFLLEYQHTYRRDKSKYYEDLTRDVVIPWNDKRLDDITKGGTFFVGLGQRFKRTGVHAALGYVKERVRYQYFDELFILSNNGNYSFPSYNDTYLTMKLGVMHDVKSLTVKADYELSRRLFTVGLGVNF